MDNRISIKFENENEFKFVQKFYLKKGYKWINGSTIIPYYGTNMDVNYEKKELSISLPHFGGKQNMTPAKQIIRQIKIDKII